MMAADDLSKYLEDLGISLGEDTAEGADLEDAFEPEPEQPAALPDLVPADAGIGERTEAFLVTLLLNFDPAYSVTVDYGEGDSEVRVDVEGGDPGRIIGRGGRTLAALEYVTNAVVNRDESRATRITIDVGGYKRRRDERLAQTAQRLADLVRKTGEPQEFEAMSAAERRVVHMALAGIPGVRSESTGEGRDRRVVAFPEG
jgi:spoIIIJ-associated protein